MLDIHKTNISGYHVFAEVREANCISCLSDHHGRNFDLIRFNQANFNHLQTVELKSAHLGKNCRACYKDEFISKAEIKDKDTRFKLRYAVLIML